MKNKKLIKISVCSILIGCMTLSYQASAFAEKNNIATASIKGKLIQNVDHPKQYLEDAINKLVEEGKLNKDKVDKIIEYKEKRAKEFKNLTKEQQQQIKKECKRKSLLKDMEEAGILTEAEAEAIREKLREMRKTRITVALNALVEQGILSKDDVRRIENYLIKAGDYRKSEYEKLKGMTESQRKEYFKNRKRDTRDIIEKMLEDKIITEKQAEEIRKALPELSKRRFREHW